LGKRPGVPRGLRWAMSNQKPASDRAARSFTGHVFQIRTDRVITVARAVLAVFALFGVWVDPSQPARYAEATYVILFVYAGCALALAAAIWQPKPSFLRFAVFAQIVDPLVFTALILLTEGPSSPFFVLFIFSTLGALMKWGWKGALAMSAAAIVLHLASAAAFHVLALGGEIEVQRFVLRTANLVVSAGMLIYFGLHQQRIAQENLRLSEWPEPVGGGAVPPVREALAYAARVFAAGRVLLVWSEPEEPWLNVAELRDGEFRQEQLGPGDFDIADLGGEIDVPFLYDRDLQQVLRFDERNALTSSLRRSVDPRFCTKYGFRRMLAVPIIADEFEGCLFVADKPNLTTDDLLVGAAVSTHIASRIEHAASAEVRKQANAAEQRLSLARNIHDSVLQSLAGAALQIEGLIKSADGQSNEFRESLRDIQERLISEQRGIRAFVGELRGKPRRQKAHPFDLKAELEGMAVRLERQWGVGIAVRVSPPKTKVSSLLQSELRQIVSEAVANAVRHGRAKHIDIDARSDNRSLSLQISDDGSGLPVHGTFDQVRLAELGIGPKSLRERVRALGGSLSIESGQQGVRETMLLPLAMSSRHEE